MSQIFFKNKSVGTGNGEYQKRFDLQRRNPINKKRIKPILCKLCKEKQQSSSGRKKYWTTINQLHGHCSFDHRNENFKPYLMELVNDILHGRLQ